MKMLDSKACVDACVSLDRVEKLMTGFRVDHPSLIISNVVESIERQSRRHGRTRSFGQATLTEYRVNEGSVTN
jgi:hypothetical protein